MAAQLKIIHEESLKAITCSECGTQIYLLEGFVTKRRDDHKTYWCPNGHAQYFPGESEAEKLKKELEVQKRRTEMAVNDAKFQSAAREREQRAFKGKLTRLKNRIGNGVCPSCNRHFNNVEQHMASKHPDFKSEPVVTDTEEKPSS